MFLKIRSRHGSHDSLRRKVEVGVRALVRFGSSTPVVNVFPNALKNKRNVIEINKIDAVKTSASKLLMKKAFTKAGVKTADWYAGNENGISVGALTDWASTRYPIVAKSHYGSRGVGNYLLKSKEDLAHWVNGKNLGGYIFEKYYDYVREYRLHVTKDGCFYTCRKMLKGDVPKAERWHRHDSNSVWMLEDNPLFDKPSNWDEIVAECVKALDAVGLDVAAMDVKVQSAKGKKGNRDNPAFIILESNSAPSLGDITTERYLAELPKIVAKKIKEEDYVK